MAWMGNRSDWEVVNPWDDRSKQIRRNVVTGECERPEDWAEDTFEFWQNALKRKAAWKPPTQEEVKEMRWSNYDGKGRLMNGWTRTNGGWCYGKLRDTGEFILQSPGGDLGITFNDEPDHRIVDWIIKMLETDPWGSFALLAQIQPNMLQCPLPGHVSDADLRAEWDRVDMNIEREDEDEEEGPPTHLYLYCRYRSIKAIVQGNEYTTKIGGRGTHVKMAKLIEILQEYPPDSLIWIEQGNHVDRWDGIIRIPPAEKYT